MTNPQPDRLDRIEQSLERSSQLIERVIDLQAQQQEQLGQHQEQIQILLNAATDHNTRIARQDVLIERLDTIIRDLDKKDSY